MRESACSGENAVENDGADHRCAAANAIANQSTENAADRPSEERERNQISGKMRKIVEFVTRKQFVQRRSYRQK